MFRSDCHAAPQRAADFSSTLPSVACVALSRRACLGGGLAALALLAGCKPATVPFKGIDLTGAQYGRDFRLRDADGRERTLADFKGQALMVFFGFTQCPDVCPTALTRALEIRELLGTDGAQKLSLIHI